MYIEKLQFFNEMWGTSFALHTHMTEMFFHFMNSSQKDFFVASFLTSILFKEITLLI